jgi:hypothetical protein
MEASIAMGVGPVDGHPTLLSSYRAELTGFLVMPYILYRICQYYNVTTGSFKLYCDNKGALWNTFRPAKGDITLFIDLIQVIQQLIVGRQ